MDRDAGHPACWAGAGRAGPGTRVTWILYPHEQARLPCYMESCHVPIALRTHRTRHLLHSPQMYCPEFPERSWRCLHTRCLQRFQYSWEFPLPPFPLWVINFRRASLYFLISSLPVAAAPVTSLLLVETKLCSELEHLNFV